MLKVLQSGDTAINSFFKVLSPQDKHILSKIMLQLPEEKQQLHNIQGS